MKRANLKILFVRIAEIFPGISIKRARKTFLSAMSQRPGSDGRDVVGGASADGGRFIHISRSIHSFIYGGCFILLVWYRTLIYLLTCPIIWKFARIPNQQEDMEGSMVSFTGQIAQMYCSDPTYSIVSNGVSRSLLVQRSATRAPAPRSWVWILRGARFPYINSRRVC